jgi:ATP-dependent RNA helicase DDX49/DBP8
MMSQALELSRRPHVLIATPGRLADHIQSHTVSVTASCSSASASASASTASLSAGSNTGGATLHLSHVRFLVLDEADRLFDPCFAEVCLAPLYPSPSAFLFLLFVIIYYDLLLSRM